MLNSNKVPLTILLVDDEPQNLQLLGNVLKKEGYSLEFAMNGDQALKWINSQQFALILLDIMMPGIDGYEVCKQIKLNEQTRNIPIIFLTAKTDTASIVKGFELGAVDYVTKPFNVSELLARVKTHLELQSSKEVIKQKNVELKELLHILCHDLANPIGGVKGLVSLSKSMPDSWLSEKRDAILRALDNGLETIDLIRKMRSIEEGKYEIELVSVNLQEAINESFSMLSERFLSKDIRLEFNGVNDQIMVLAEKTSFINSVLNNIFTNAIKFSFPGSIIVINVTRENERIILSVKDSGIGIPEKLIGDLFDISKITTRVGTNEEIGTGFGMPLVKKFVTAYGGEIEIVSTEKTDDSSTHGTMVLLKLKRGREEKYDQSK